ncbi:DnaJ C-terminal domain-containing protein [Pseudonocardia bannensis]|uniref:DnaJ domain-containing protein n=1 Tax=Pseudonocardia bannensis TaxID=630973 RepID=A0A848DJJ3_9PSEU|nr:DnaJ C-terminal domain-containing protein [Pseudonocardia bannensis]NMH92723.1 DnaJ domain-containing protein [Pseudonocardia bannensis]
MARDYYEVLGVSRDADASELQQAFRRLARQNHPDVNKDPAAEERFKEINEAYSVLEDPETRRKYDRFGENFRQVPDDWEERVGAGARAGGGFGGGYGGYGGGFRRGGGVRSGGYGAGFGGDRGYESYGGFEGVDLEDLLGGMFGRRGRTGPVAGADQEAELPLSVEEAYRGGRRQITLEGTSGPRNYTVNIPPGVTEGRRIRLAGEGGRGLNGGEPGDLYLIVKLQGHPKFKVKGRDITVDLLLAPWEAALGATVPVRTPGGETKVTVPAGSSTGRRLRLRGEGMPDQRGRPGDLYAEVKIVVPPRPPTDRERELWSELAATANFDPRRGDTTRGETTSTEDRPTGDGRGGGKRRGGHRGGGRRTTSDAGDSDDTT